MKFGIFYEHQIPRPWSIDSEYNLLHESLAQSAAEGIDRIPQQPTNPLRSFSRKADPSRVGAS